MKFRYPLIFLLLILCYHMGNSQELYTARGYWTELNKDTYKKIREKKEKGQTLTDQESFYLQDYEQYLATYYQRMSDDERRMFETMKTQWASEDALKPAAQPTEPVDFELRTRDRLLNGLYGAYYGASIVAIGEIDNEAAIGIPLIMAGLWQLGPVMNPKKYDNIRLSTIRAGNTGKLLGLGYGLALGLAIGGDSDETGKLALALSTIGSISLGELAFQKSKKKEYSEGYIEMMRLYGFLGPAVTGLGVASFNVDQPNLIGAALLGGGIGGLLIGSKQAKKYDYSSGDVDAISSLTWITTGIGMTIAAESVVNNNENYGLLLIPASTAILGTMWGQRSVRNVHLTKKQGSAISLSSGGAALIGLGIVAMIGTDSPAVAIGVPSAAALLTHQLVFANYRSKNLGNLKLGRMNQKNRPQLSLRVMPENLMINRQTSERVFQTTGQLANPIVKLKLAL